MPLRARAARNLGRWRQAKTLSPEELGDRVHVSRNSVGQLQREGTAAGVDLRRRLADLLAVDGSATVLRHRRRWVTSVRNMARMTAKPPITTLAPTGAVEDYDRAHATIYLRLLDAEAAAADWRDVARIVLGLGDQRAEEEARRIHHSHLARAQWLRDGGYLQLLALPKDATD